MSASTTISNFAVGSSISGFKRISATGMNATLDVSGNNLDSTALNEIYTNLSATGATKSISVSNNWGTANDNPSIATAKGWAVTG
jgi:phosphoribosylformylglycinamidine (FGAM) synthase-like enzyme